MNFVGLAKWLQKLPRLNLAAGIALFFGAVLIAFLIVAGVAYRMQGKQGLIAAAVAAAVCAVSSLLALVTTAIARGPHAALYAMLFGMAFRLGLPMAAGLYLMDAGGPLAEAGVFGLIVVFYLITLIVETPLSLALLAAGRRDTNAC